jgi:hypothetical protein
MKLKGLVLKDLHFGHKRTEEMYKEELPIVSNYLREHGDDIDILNINGDYFDRKLSATEPAVAYAIAFFDELMTICIEKEIKVRIILGTRSHDLNQYTTLFQHYFERVDLDIKYMTTITEENIDGINILYVPEEYPENNELYYAEYKKKSYHVMHGHGTWNFISFIANAENEKIETGTRSAPVFIYEEWENALKNGFAIFGHIHKRQTFKNVYYGGSFSAWGFGDASEKGFIIYEIDTDANTWKVEHINNEKAPGYKSLSLKSLFKGQDLTKLTLEEIQVVLNEQLKGTDNIKVDFNGISEDKIKIFKDLFKTNENVKVEVKKKKASLKEDAEPAIYDVYGYILKRELPLDKTIQKFIKEEYDEDFTLERINEIITE